MVLLVRVMVLLMLLKEVIESSGLKIFLWNSWLCGEMLLIMVGLMKMLVLVVLLKCIVNCFVLVWLRYVWIFLKCVGLISVLR